MQLVPTSLHVMFAGLIFILSFFQYESPRYLVKRLKDEEALQTLARIRNLPADDEYILREFGSIQTSFQMELEGMQGMGWKDSSQRSVLQR